MVTFAGPKDAARFLQWKSKILPTRQSAIDFVDKGVKKYNAKRKMDDAKVVVVDASITAQEPHKAPTKPWKGKCYPRHHYHVAINLGQVPFKAKAHFVF